MLNAFMRARRHGRTMRFCVREISSGMFLTATNLYPYLADVGLSSPTDITDEDFRIIELGRRNRNFKVIRTTHPSLFIKQVPMFHPETISSFEREAACMRLARNDRRMPTLHAVCPDLRSYDDSRHVLVYNSFEASETLAAVAGRLNSALPALMHQLALTLASLHLETSVDGCLRELCSVLSGTPPWVLGIGEHAESVMPNMNGARRHIVTLVRQSPELSHGLAALHANWRHRCLIHGDLKWDNVMIVNLKGRHELRLIDWELADVGEPLWDVAQLIGALLQYWILNVPADRVNFDSPDTFVGAPVSLKSLSSVFTDLWGTYLDATASINPPEQISLNLASRLVGARLVLLAFELLPTGDIVTSHAHLALRLAKYFFFDPLGAASDLLGISPSFATLHNDSALVDRDGVTPWMVAL
jgi:Phosphotransferase enzyme family